MSGLILDAFAGMGGWDEGLLYLGHTNTIGVEWDKSACITAQAAGHRRIRADVTNFALEPLIGKVDGLVMSPPCTDFSVAGKRAGIEGKTGQLMWSVPEWTETLMPRWLAVENVPPARKWFDYFIPILEDLGYMCWMGVLNAADYGVPQTRRRAFLLAARDRQPVVPVATHAKVVDGKLFDDRLPWVTMANALGWGMKELPYPTIACSNGSGGPDKEKVGGSGARKIIYGEQSQGRWVHLEVQNQPDWTFERPATTIVSSFRPDIVAGPGYRTTVSRQDAPGSIKISEEDALVLQSFREDYPVHGSRTNKFRQIGNAVPPLLAAHVCKQFLD